MPRPTDIDLSAAQELLGISFSRSELLVEALTHPSYAAEHDGVRGYDRLEFLGDSVLGFIVADELFRTHPDQDEGLLTRHKISVVSGAALSGVAGELGIGSLIRMGKGAAAGGGRGKSSVLENCLEAIIGAIFVDQGLDVAREFVITRLASTIDSGPVPPEDPKSALQELVQADGDQPPYYQVIKAVGPPHERVFTVQVLAGEKVLGAGKGLSKKAAEKAAAAAALDILKP